MWPHSERGAWHLVHAVSMVLAPCVSDGLAAHVKIGKKPCKMQGYNVSVSQGDLSELPRQR